MRVTAILTTALAMAAAFIVLLGFFFPVPALLELRAILTNWAMTIGGMAVFIGVLNLVAVHIGKIQKRQKGSGLGVILVFSLLSVFTYGVLFGVEDPLMQMTMNAVIAPVEAALMALLVVTLTYAGIRLLRWRGDLAAMLFLAVVVFFLAAIAPKPFDNGILDGLIVNVAGTIAQGGARGLLIGVALGALLTGLRVMFGIDRPYGGD